MSESATVTGRENPKKARTSDTNGSPDVAAEAYGRVHKFSLQPFAQLRAKIEHNGGFTRDLKWRPLTDSAAMWQNNRMQESSPEPQEVETPLGFLAAVCGDGTVSV